VFWQLTERECQLDGALLRCGKLREGLELFKEWLDDVEVRQLKQKPFTIDHKALKPQQQIQEVCVRPSVFCLLAAHLTLSTKTQFSSVITASRLNQSLLPKHQNFMMFLF